MVSTEDGSERTLLIDVTHNPNYRDKTDVEAFHRLRRDKEFLDKLSNFYYAHGASVIDAATAAGNIPFWHLTIGQDVSMGELMGARQKIFAKMSLSPVANVLMFRQHRVEPLRGNVGIFGEWYNSHESGVFIISSPRPTPNEIQLVAGNVEELNKELGRAFAERWPIYTSVRDMGPWKPKFRIMTAAELFEAFPGARNTIEAVNRRPRTTGE
ncbi:hypothetical protein D3C86_1600550 [compost metagenome]